MKKGRVVLSLILNILILGCAVFGCANLILGWFPLKDVPAVKPDWTDFFKDVGNLAVIFAGLVALVFVVVDIVLLVSKKGKIAPAWASILKLCSAGISLTAILQFYLVYTIILKDPSTGAAAGATAVKFNLAWNGGLAVATVVPLLTILDFIFVELQPKLKMSASIWSIAFPLIAMGAVNVYTYLTKPEILNYHLTPVDYFGANKISLMEGVGWLLMETLVALLGAIIFLAIRNGIRKAAIKEEPVAVVAAPATTEAVAEAKPEETKEEPVAYSPVFVEDKKEEKAPAAKPAPAPQPVKEEPKKTGKKVIIIKSPDDKIPEHIDIQEDTGSEEAEEAEEVAAASKNYNTPRVYHISKQASGKWQVKLATGERAIKLFDTQDQAIAYAKSLVRTQGGSIRVHSLTGKMRKE